MKCICGDKARMIKMITGKKPIGFLLCCPSFEICGINSNWQPTKKIAIREFRRAVQYGNRDKVEKQCKTCGEIKNTTEFYRSKTARDGYYNICKKCYQNACKINQAERKARGT